MNITENESKRPEVWTVISLLRWLEPYFQKHNIESPRLVAELLLSKVLDCKRIDLYVNFEKPVTRNELQILKSLIKRITNHEPLHYVLASAQFLDLTIQLNRKVFIPRPETEILVQRIFEDLNKWKDEKLNILDIGCGSGAISLALAKFFRNSTVFAIDTSSDAIAQTLENAQYHKLDNIRATKLDILNQSLDKEFDIIVSNPPYIPLNEMQELEPNLRYEPEEALTDFADGLSFYRRFNEIFPKILKPQGFAFLELGYNQAVRILEIFDTNTFEIAFYEDFLKLKRIAKIKFRN